MKFLRPYYIDFSVFHRLGKVSKTFNFQKFSKKKSMLRFTLWNHSCFKKQSYIRSSKYVGGDFPKAFNIIWKIWYSIFQHDDLFFNFWGNSISASGDGSRHQTIPLGLIVAILQWILGCAKSPMCRSLSQRANAPKRACTELPRVLWYGADFSNLGSFANTSRLDRADEPTSW